MMHYWLGESIVAKRAEDLLVIARKLSREVNGAKVEVVAKGRAAIPAAHARFAEPGLFGGLQCRYEPLSWKALIADPQAPYRFANVIHGAYRHYDWVDLLP